MIIEKTKGQLPVTEISSYLMFLCFMGARGIGLVEGQWLFSVAIACGFVCFLAKLLVTKWSIWEWIINIGLLALGVVVFLNNGHIDLLTAICFIIGMKDVKLDKAVKAMLSIWGILFVLTALRALIGIAPGCIGTQTKAGMNFGVIRYSLGFSHPNVLHITYLVVVLLVLYVTNRTGKKLLRLCLGLLAGNIYVFLYSVSYTGFIVVLFALVVALIVDCWKTHFQIVNVATVLFCIVCFWLTIIASRLLPETVVTIIDKVINQRCGMTARVFDMFPPMLLGNTQDIHQYNLNLDCSYAYCLFYQGIIAFGLYFISFIGSLIYQLRAKNKKAVTLFTAMGLSGVTEQYLGNTSFKNISLLFIGDYLYNHLLCQKNADRKAIFSVESIKIPLLGFDKRISSFCEKIRIIKIKKATLYAIPVALLSCVVFLVCWTEPKHFYYVYDNQVENSFYYTDNMYDELEIENSVIVGDIYDGCYLEPITYVSFMPETVRGIVSSLLWGYIGGLAVIVCITAVRIDAKADKFVNNNTAL